MTIQLKVHYDTELGRQLFYCSCFSLGETARDPHTPQRAVEYVVEALARHGGFGFDCTREVEDR